MYFAEVEQTGQSLPFFSANEFLQPYLRSVLLTRQCQWCPEPWSRVRTKRTPQRQKRTEQNLPGRRRKTTTRRRAFLRHVRKALAAQKLCVVPLHLTKMQKNIFVMNKTDFVFVVSSWKDISVRHSCSASSMHWMQEMHRRSSEELKSSACMLVSFRRNGRTKVVTSSWDLRECFAEGWRKTTHMLVLGFDWNLEYCCKIFYLPRHFKVVISCQTTPLVTRPLCTYWTRDNCFHDISSFLQKMLSRQQSDSATPRAHDMEMSVAKHFVGWNGFICFISTANRTRFSGFWMKWFKFYTYLFPVQWRQKVCSVFRFVFRF